MICFTKELCNKTIKRQLIVYGTGAVGEVVSYALKKWGREPDLYCDHDPEKHSFFQHDVITAEQLRDHSKAIVIIAFKDFLRTAIEIVKDAGIQEYYSAELLVDETVDDVSSLSKGAQEFLVRKYNYREIVHQSEKTDSITFQHLEWMLTERCTLRCRDCSALVPFFKAPKDHSFERTKMALDRLLSKTDYVAELSILGGEPLLYPFLSEAINSFSDNPKIGAVVIYTNGTIIPDSSLIPALKSRKVWVHISDYQEHSPSVPKIEAVLEKEDIRFFVKQYDCWQAAGDPFYREETEEQLTQKYSRCFKARCYSLFEDRLYGCARASNGAAAGIMPDEEFLCFSSESSQTSDRESLKQFLMKPYLESCKYCNGMINGAANVEPAIQVINL